MDNLPQAGRLDYRFKRCGGVSLSRLRSDSCNGVVTPYANMCLRPTILLTDAGKASRRKEKRLLCVSKLTAVTVDTGCCVADVPIVATRLITPV
jgi:hypothetical protein